MGNEEFWYFEVCPVYSTMSMSNESGYQKLGSLIKDFVCVRIFYACCQMRICKRQYVDLQQKKTNVESIIQGK